MNLLSGSDMMFLVALAIYRYVAICKPLHYITFMSLQVLIRLLLCSYEAAFVLSYLDDLHIEFVVPWTQYCNSLLCDLPFVILLAYK